jgi:hypothetical protein
MITTRSWANRRRRTLRHFTDFLDLDTDNADTTNPATRRKVPQQTSEVRE